MDTTTTRDMSVPADPSPVPVTGIDLTLEETLTLQALWLHAERVDWAVYDRLRLRVLAWPSPVSPGPARSEEVSQAEPVAGRHTR